MSNAASYQPQGQTPSYNTSGSNQAAVCSAKHIRKCGQCQWVQGEAETVCTGGTTGTILETGAELPFSLLPHLRDMHCEDFHEALIRCSSFLVLSGFLGKIYKENPVGYN